MKVLVTGAGGFVGAALCRRLTSKGHDVQGLSSKEQDISKPFSFSASFDCVVHLAAHNITHLGDKDTAAYTRVNVQGTKHVLQGVKTDRFMFLSTAKIYKNEGLPLTEESPVAPLGAYEKSKLEAELVCRGALQYDQLVIVRSANILGWGQAPKAVLPVFFEKAIKNKPLDIIVSGRTPLQFVYVEDIVDVFEALISHPRAQGCFNIANDEIVTVEDLARKVIAVTGSSSKLNVRNRAQVTAAPIVCEKARRELGWSAKTSLDQILQDYYSHV